MTFLAWSTRSVGTPQRWALPRRKPAVSASRVASAASATPTPKKRSRAVVIAAVGRMEISNPVRPPWMNTGEVVLVASRNQVSDADLQLLLCHLWFIDPSSRHRSQSKAHFAVELAQHKRSPAQRVFTLIPREGRRLPVTDVMRLRRVLRAVLHSRETPGPQAVSAGQASCCTGFGKPERAFAGAGRAPRRSARKIPCSAQRSSTGIVARAG